MEARRLLPYIIVLLVLAFALGSLPRSEPGGSLLFHSYWLLYLIYLGPFVALGIMVTLTVLIALNWRGLSEGLGFGFAQRRKQRKPRSPLSFMVAAFFWALAIGFLLLKCGGIFCGTASANSTSTVKQIVGQTLNGPDPFQAGASAVVALSNFFETPWFGFAFLGLLIVSGIVVFQSIRVALHEMGELPPRIPPGNQVEGLEAVGKAMKLVRDPSMDPRDRIIACYQHLILTASKLGAPISSDQTARELEREIRIMFGLPGPAIRDLTGLFEEARYSMHTITEEDRERAYQYLQSIAEELHVQISSEP